MYRYIFRYGMKRYSDDLHIGRKIVAFSNFTQSNERTLLMRTGDNQHSNGCLKEEWENSGYFCKIQASYI